MAYVEPLELQTIFTGIFAGSPDIFTAIAIGVISAMAGYFRMNNISLLFMVGLFLLMFTQYISLSLLTLVVIVGSLIGGYVISKLID